MVKRLVLKLKNRKIMEELNKINIRNSALQDYKKYVWNNRYEEDERLIKKLKRNFVLAEEVNHNTKRYGNLYITYENNTISGIYNKKGLAKGLNIDVKLKKELDYILGI